MSWQTRKHLSTLSSGWRDLEPSYAYVRLLDAAIKSRTERGERSVQTSTTKIFYQRGSRSPPIAKRRGESRRDKFSNATAALSVDSYFRESCSSFRRELAEEFVVSRSSPPMVFRSLPKGSIFSKADETKSNVETRIRVADQNLCAGSDLLAHGEIAKQKSPVSLKGCVVERRRAGIELEFYNRYIEYRI